MSSFGRTPAPDGRSTLRIGSNSAFASLRNSSPPGFERELSEVTCRLLLARHRGPCVKEDAGDYDGRPELVARPRARTRLAIRHDLCGQCSTRVRRRGTLAP